MNTLQRLTGSSLVMISAVVASSGLVRAEMFQEQYQNVSSSHSFSYNCSGDSCSNGSGEMKATSEVRQHQSQGVGSDDSSFRSHFSYGTKKYNNGGKRRSNRDTSGKVALDWDHRGGTCHIRYTENNAQDYRYSTSTNCDEGGITIGGLKVGTNYRFQVKKDDGSWSNSMVIKAW